jgi:hypothetical protein
MATAPARYTKVGTGGNVQPVPGGIGMTAVTALIIRIALSKIDADGVAHPGLVGAVGEVIVIKSSAGTGWNVVIGPNAATVNDYWYDATGDVADATGLAAITGNVTVYLPADATNPAGLWVTGTEILAHVRVTTPTASDAAWADECALGVSHGIDAYLGDIADPLPAGLYEEVHANALTAGGDAYRRRDAPFGLAGYSDAAGISERVARDYLNGVYPQLDRHRVIGLA